MKKFKYKLDALLKLRELEEHQVKVQLGALNREISRIEEEIQKHKTDIGVGYESQEALVNSGVEGKMLQFYPYFTEGKKRHIEALENQLWAFKNKYELKRKELQEKRGKVKVLDNMKEKDRQAFKKELLKEEMGKIEENVQNWSVRNLRAEKGKTY